MGIASLAMPSVERLPLVVVTFAACCVGMLSRVGDPVVLMVVVVRDLVVTVPIVIGLSDRWLGRRGRLRREVIVDASADVIVRQIVKDEVKRGDADASRQHQEERGKSEVR